MGGDDDGRLHALGVLAAERERLGYPGELPDDPVGQIGWEVVVDPSGQPRRGLRHQPMVSHSGHPPVRPAAPGREAVERHSWLRSREALARAEASSAVSRAAGLIVADGACRYGPGVAGVLVTGMSGAGKTTVLEQLRRRGRLTVDTDYGGAWPGC